MAKLAAYAQYQANQQNQAKSKTGMFIYLEWINVLKDDLSW